MTTEEEQDSPARRDTEGSDSTHNTVLHKHIGIFPPTQTVVAVVRQHEAIVAGAPVVARYVDAVVYTAAVVVVLTLVCV